MIDQRLLQFRVSPAPRLSLPFGVRSVGHYCVTPNQAVDVPRAKPFVQVFWGVAGHGFFTFKGRKLRVAANEVFVYVSGSMHDLASGPSGFEYHWFTLDGALADALVDSFGLREPWPRYAGPAPVKLFARLTEQLKDVSLFTEKDATATAYALLMLASDGGLRPERELPEHAQVEFVRRRLLERIADPQFAVEALADELKIHRSLLSRKFRRALGLSPKQFLQSLRINRAMSLLRTTQQAVHQIAQEVGFEDPNYFARAFKVQTGTTPQAFRNG